MSSAITLSELITRDELLAAALRGLSNGLNDVTRFANFGSYTFTFEGDEVVLTGAMRSEIETAIGHTLIEQPALGHNGKKHKLSLLRLVAPSDSLALIRSALEAVQASTLGQ